MVRCAVSGGVTKACPTANPKLRMAEIEEGEAQSGEELWAWGRSDGDKGRWGNVAAHCGERYAREAVVGWLPMLEKAISQVGWKLEKWSAPATKVLDVFPLVKMERSMPKWIFANPDAPDTPISSLGVGSLHELFRMLLSTVQAKKGARVLTTEGRAHGDLHGRNLLLDIAGNVPCA